MVSHLALIFFILLTMINPNDEPKVLDIDWYDVCLGIWAFGYWVKCSTEAVLFTKHFFSFAKEGSKSSHWRRSIKSVRDIYKLLQFLCCSLILLGKLFKFIGFQNCNDEKESTNWHTIFMCTNDNPLEYCDNSYLKTGYSLIGIGATICILNLLHWFELNAYLGPIIVSLRQTIGDILKILTTFVVFLFAFSVGLHFSLRLSNMYCKEELEKVKVRNEVREIQDCKHESVDSNMTGFTLEDNINHFRVFQESIKTCFWSLFDPGHPEVIGCTQGPPRHLGMFLWASYQIGNVVIVMNLLIALMNATIAGIQDDQISQWRLARTQIWKQYFDHKHMVCLPVPFNLLEMLTNFFMKIISLLIKLRVESGTDIELNEAGNGKEKEYLDLISELCERYINRKSNDAGKILNK